MALMQLPQQQPGFGYGFGVGLGGGIQNLIDMKLANLERQQKIKNLEASLAPIVSPEKASLYAALGADNPQVLGSLLKEEMEYPSRMIRQKAIAGEDITPGISAEVPKATMPFTQELKPLPSIDRSKLIEEPTVPTEKLISEKTYKAPIKEQKFESQTVKLSKDIDRMKRAMKNPNLKAKDFDKLADMVQKKEDLLSKSLFKERDIQEKAKRFEKKQELREKKFYLQERKYLNDLDIQKRKLKKEEQKDIDTETKEIYKKIVDQAKSAQENDMRLNRMEELNEKGTMAPISGRLGSVYNSLLETISKGIFGFGIDLTSLMTADAQEFNKLSKDFLKNVKSIFGARVTQQEVQMYLKTIPSLSQSEDGRRKVINNLKLFNKASKLRLQTMNELIKENNGRRPRNLDSLVEEKLAPKLDKIAKVFRSQAIGPKKGWGEWLFTQF